MSNKRFQSQDYAFELRLLNQGITLSSEHLGVMLAFSSIDELCSALDDFQKTGKGLIASHLRKGHAIQKQNDPCAKYAPGSVERIDCERERSKHE
jgi:hypothetical protein